MKPIHALGLSAFLAVGCYILWPRKTTEGVRPKLEYRSAAAVAAAKDRNEADVIYGSANYTEAKERYQAFVAEHAGSKDPEVQDEVGAARIRLGYIETKEKDYAEAREVFKDAEKNYKGTGAFSSAFGGVPDQAAYQAAVTYVAEGNTKEAKDAFIAFLKERQLSPLVHAAYRRLVRINDGNSTEEYEALLQSAIAEQEKQAKLELASCGPKAIAFLLKLLKQPEREYKEIAQLCGTNESGTTMLGMKEGLEELGISAKGMNLNRADFAKTQVPAIWLAGDHYTILLEVSEKEARVYDPVYKSERKIQLPAADDKKFSAAVLLIETKSAQPSTLGGEKE